MWRQPRCVASSASSRVATKSRGKFAWISQSLDLALGRHRRPTPQACLADQIGERLVSGGGKLGLDCRASRDRCQSRRDAGRLGRSQVGDLIVAEMSHRRAALAHGRPDLAAALTLGRDEQPRRCQPTGLGNDLLQERPRKIHVRDDDVPRCERRAMFRDREQHLAFHGKLQVAQRAIVASWCGCPAPAAGRCRPACRVSHRGPPRRRSGRPRSRGMRRGARSRGTRRGVRNSVAPPVCRIIVAADAGKGACRFVAASAALRSTANFGVSPSPSKLGNSDTLCSCCEIARSRAAERAALLTFSSRISASCNSVAVLGTAGSAAVVGRIADAGPRSRRVRRAKEDRTGSPAQAADDRRVRSVIDDHVEFWRRAREPDQVLARPQVALNELKAWVLECEKSLSRTRRFRHTENRRATWRSTAHLPRVRPATTVRAAIARPICNTLMRCRLIGENSRS